MKTSRLLIVSVLVTVTALCVSSCGNRRVTTNPNLSPPSAPVVSGDDILAGAKVFGGVLAGALEDGIAFEAQLATDGTIDSEREPQIRQWLLDGQKATADFNARISKYDHFDPTSRADIASFLEEATGFIAKLESEGILRIKNPKSRLIASAILLGAKATIRTYKASFAQVK